MYLVMNIGCIECGVSSKIVGIFANEERANKIASDCYEEHNWREGGQNSFEVFVLPDPEVVDPEYVDPEYKVTP